MTDAHQPEISRSIFREAHDAFFILRPADLRIFDVNPAAQRLTGLRRKQLLAMSLEDLLDTQNAKAVSDLIEACQTTAQFVGAADYVLKVAGGTLAVQISASRIHTEPETLALLVVRDVSKQHALEEQLRHARQMEALGRLSAGVAHEFNNLLTIINGYSAIIQDRGDAQSETQLTEIQKAANRGAIFTRQLLDFGSKRQPTERVFDVREVVTGLETMLRPLLGASITVATQQAETPLLIEADAARIEQLLVNLAVNSRDAMPDEGTLRITTSSRKLTQTDCATLPGLLPGQHVVVQVADTGSGMDSATAERAFEPFFTTKTNTGGTGLGLAMVYNAVKQSRGHVAFETAPGRGTTFTMHFPLSDKPIAPVTDTEPAPIQKRQATERILLVEDDASVRILVKDLLQKAGYTVLEARHGAEALQLSEGESRHIDLMLTDYLMPGMRGDDLAQRVLTARPTMRVLYMSGCVSPDGIGEDPKLLGSVLHKPFSPAELLQRLRTELDHG